MASCSCRVGQRATVAVATQSEAAAPGFVAPPAPPATAPGFVPAAATDLAAAQARIAQLEAEVLQLRQMQGTVPLLPEIPMRPAPVYNRMTGELLPPGPPLMAPVTRTYRRR